MRPESGPRQSQAHNAKTEYRSSFSPRPRPLAVAWIILIHWGNTATALSVSSQNYYVI